MVNPGLLPGGEVVEALITIWMQKQQLPWSWIQTGQQDATAEFPQLVAEVMHDRATPEQAAALYRPLIG